ncbi:MAG: primosomal protein N', partial [Peptostreptococcaceae bacterium]
MKKYAKVIVRNNSIYTDNLFTYEVPDFFKEELELGHRILVPFGRGNKPTEAFVFEITNEIEENIKTKEVVDLLDEKPIFKVEDLELVKWMKNRYL